MLTYQAQLAHAVSWMTCGLFTLGTIIMLLTSTTTPTP
jgi:hypothetical protein